MISVFLLAAAPTVQDALGVADAVSQGCTRADSKEVVVCGSRDEQHRYRLPKLSETYEQDWRVPNAATAIAGLAARVHVDPVELPGGVKSNRIMLTISTRF